jgi:hypothetical protein
MKKIIGLMLLVFACNSGYCSNDLVAAKKKEAIKEVKEEILVLLFAKDCYLKLNKADKSKGTLTLYNVSHTVTYFSDRPVRQAGQEPLKKFMDNWHESFKKDPPNAAFVCFFSEKQQKFSDIPVELTNPVYDDKSDRVTFDVTIIEKDRTIEEGHYGEIVLFIDNMTPFH